MEARSAVEQQKSEGTGWFLTGKMASSIPEDAKTGFILVKAGIDPCSLVQKVIAEEWPNETTSLNDELIIVPGTLRDMSDAPIIGSLLNSQAPIQGGNFKIICYWIQNQHCYLSQMQHILPDVKESSLSQEGIPPVINFTGNNHGLKVLGLVIRLEKLLDQEQKVKTSDFKFEYSVNGQVESCPDQLKEVVVVLNNRSIWKTANLQDLFKQLYESKSNAIVADDGTICLIAQHNQTLDKSCIDFFSQGEGYETFSCLFDTNDYKIKFYTQKQRLCIEEIEVNTAQSKPEQPKEELKITLEGEGASITLQSKSWGVFGSNTATLALPQVKLEPSGFGKNKLNHCGFLIAKAADLVPSKMDDHSPIVDNFINANQKVSYDDKKFLIFEEDAQKDQLAKSLYDAYKNEEASKDALVISYWAQYKDQIIWSEPVSIEIIWKK